MKWSLNRRTSHLDSRVRWAITLGTQSIKELRGRKVVDSEAPVKGGGKRLTGKEPSTRSTPPGP